MVTTPPPAPTTTSTVPWSGLRRRQKKMSAAEGQRTQETRAYREHGAGILRTGTESEKAAHRYSRDRFPVVVYRV